MTQVHRSGNPTQFFQFSMRERAVRNGDGEQQIEQLDPLIEAELGYVF